MTKLECKRQRDEDVPLRLTWALRVIINLSPASAFAFAQGQCLNATVFLRLSSLTIVRFSGHVFLNEAFLQENTNSCFFH